MQECIHIDKPRRDALAERLCSLARMASGMAHELNNVFGAIKSNVGMMRHHLPDDSALRQNLNHIDHASCHASALTGMLHIYTHRQTEHLHAVNLTRQLPPLVDEFAAALPERVKLLSEPLHGKHEILACPDMFDQAVNGILQNAFDALPGTGGEIHIEASGDLSHIDDRQGLFFGPVPAGNATLLEIRDNGEGMSAGVLEHVLEPFFSTRIRAHGLGLVPAVGLVFHCNAAIQILSAPTHGTRFRLILPTAP